MGVVRGELQGEIPMGRVLGLFAKAEAAAACGCRQDQLVVGKLACIEEGHDKSRAVFDAAVAR
eukprot:6512880-Lingulodinium_polyedra.AAC.1